MTIKEAKILLREKNMYFIKEGSAFGTYDEYVAKLADLWDEQFAEGDEAITIDELLEDPDFEEIAKNCHKNETSPSEAVKILFDMLQNDGEENTADYEGSNSNLAKELVGSYAKLLSSDEKDVNESSAGYPGNLLAESWYNNLGLSADDALMIQRTFETYASAKNKTNNNIKGGYMTPDKRVRYYNKFKDILEMISERPETTERDKARIRNEMELLQDENWYRYIQSKNPGLSARDIPTICGHAGIEEAAGEAHAEQPAERPAARPRRITTRWSDAAADAAADAAVARSTNDRERRMQLEHPEPEDMLSRREMAADSGEELASRQVTRRRMRTVNRDFVDHYRINTAMIKLNINVTNDPETREEVKTLISQIKERLRTQFGSEPELMSLCAVDGSLVDVEIDGVPEQEYHVVIKMPASYRNQIAEFVKDEMEDTFTFVTSEHPEDSVYEFDFTGNRDETVEDEYEYDQPAERIERRRPQASSVRRHKVVPKWRVHFTLANDDGTDSGIQRMVVISAPTAEDAKNKVENPEDIDSAYATGVFAVTGVDRV